MNAVLGTASNEQHRILDPTACLFRKGLAQSTGSASSVLWKQRARFCQRRIASYLLAIPIKDLGKSVV